jgi:Inositol hexakisphosphate
MPYVRASHAECAALLQGLRQLAAHIAAAAASEAPAAAAALSPGPAAASRARVVVVDTREELSLYVRGHPFTRRELEMPTASMHHAGIRWRELAKLEAWLRSDVVASSAVWRSAAGERGVLIHHELAVRCSLSRLDPCTQSSQLVQGRHEKEKLSPRACCVRTPYASASLSSRTRVWSV